VTMESTVPYVIWLIVSMFISLALVIAFPGLALWVPRTFGFM